MFSRLAATLAVEDLDRFVNFMEKRRRWIIVHRRLVNGNETLRVLGLLRLKPRKAGHVGKPNPVRLWCLFGRKLLLRSTRLCPVTTHTITADPFVMQAAFSRLGQLAGKFAAAAGAGVRRQFTSSSTPGGQASLLQTFRCASAPHIWYMYMYMQAYIIQ
jgi:hypothetical protein